MNEEELKLLYNDVFTRWTYARQNCASLHKDADHFYNVYYSWEHKDDYGYNDNYDPAIGYRNIENSRAFTRCNVLEPGITAARQEDSEKAVVMNSIIKADYANSDIQKAMDSWWLNMLISGTGALKLGWNFEEKAFWRWVETDEELMTLAGEAFGVMQQKRPDDELTLKYQTVIESGDINLIKEFLKTGVIPNIQPENGYTGFKVRDISQSDRPCFEIVPIQDLAWLGCGDTIRKVDCIFRRFYVSREQLISWQANNAPDWFNLQNVIDTCSEGFGQDTSSSQYVDIHNGRSIRTGMMIPLIEETRRDPKTGVIWETVINENSSQVIRHRKMPYFHNEYPYFSIRIFGSTSDFAGISLFAPLESSIGEYIKTYNEILENGQLAINKVFLTRFAGRNSAPQLHFFSGNLIASEGYDDIKPLDIPDIRPASIALLDRIKQEMEEITGCPAAMGGQPMGDSSGGNAGALEQFQFFQTARFAAMQHQIAVELSALTMQMVKLHQQYDFDGRTVYVEDSERGDRWVFYRPSDYAGQFVANSDPRSMLPTHNAVKRAQLLSAYNMLGRAKVAAIDEKTNQPISELILNPQEIVREILSTFDLLNNRKLFNRHGEITCIDPDTLPPVPQPSPEEVQQSQQDNSPANISPEAMANLQMVSEQTGIPLEELIAQGRQILDQGQMEAQMPVQIQGGAEVAPARAFAMGGGAMPMANGQNNNNTMTGTDGMPPIKGGPQQHGGGQISPNNVPLPQTEGAASQSSYSLQ